MKALRQARSTAAVARYAIPTTWRSRDVYSMKDEREHFILCPACGRWIDMRNLGEVLEHERACEGSPAPPPH